MQRDHQHMRVSDDSQPIFYVAPNGSNQNPGTKDKPFATLERARDAVRNAKKTTKEPITVFVRGGIYYLTEPIVFTSEIRTGFCQWAGMESSHYDQK